jgi:hypothetical protein
MTLGLRVLLLCCSLLLLVGRVGSVIISVPVLHIRCRPKTAVRDDNGARGRLAHCGDCR